MIKKSGRIICTLLILTTMVLPTSAMILPKGHFLPVVPFNEDFDPLVENIIVTVTIKEIRALKTIDILSDPDFYIKVKINDNEFISDVWRNMMYVENPNWSASSEVPKDNEFVNVTIELWDKGVGMGRLCDISPDYGSYQQCRTVELTYSIATGVWWGDDYLEDLSGYGRLSGIDDNSIYEQDRDCELWFTIAQNDFDEDGFPYWLEVNMYNTSPLFNNRGEDADSDGIPIEWEYTFGLTYFEWGHDEGYYMVYSPFNWENHSAFDDDEDGLDNIEEYKTSPWGSDPFRKDIFLELDQMGEGPNGEGSTVPNGAFDLLRDSYSKRNIVWHIDDGRLGGGEFIPFKDNLNDQVFSQWYWDYFMHKDEQNWRRGVFHWAIVTYNQMWAAGFTFSSRVNGMFALDCFTISSNYMDKRAKMFPIINGIQRGKFNREMARAFVYAGVMMHETGHSLNIQAPGVDVGDSVYPWQINFWRFGPYRSVMNYRYCYSGLVDYSDGSRGKNDYDDWGTIDLTLINPRTHW